MDPQDNDDSPTGGDDDGTPLAHGSDLQQEVQPTGTVDLGALATEMATLPEGFDPSIHAVGPDGTPRRRSNGDYALKRGRKPGQQKGASTNGQQIQPTQNSGGAFTGKSEDQISNDEAARQLANAIQVLGVVGFGAEWCYSGPEEAKAVRVGLKNYMDAKGQINLPPEIGLLLTLGSYAGPRFMLPETRSRMSRLKGWVVDKYKKIRGL